MSLSHAKKPRTVSFRWIRAAKAADRKRDWIRLARREITPIQLQRENSLFRNASRYAVLNLSAVARAVRRYLNHAKA